MKTNASPVILLLTTTFLLLTPFGLRAQSESVPIEHERTLPSKSVLTQAEELRKAGRLLSAPDVAARLEKPLPGRVELVPALDKPLSAREVAKRARAGGLHIGWYYICPHCSHWHTQLMGAYAISRDAIATGHHCVDPDNNKMREGYLIAVDSKKKVHPVTAVLATNPLMDACVLRVDGGDLEPLALNDNVEPGDSAYLLSDPLGQSGYFSQGIVNRFFKPLVNPADAGKFNEDDLLRMNVSTDWAPGSSGAAVLDQCANVIGHVATISPLAESGNLAINPQLKQTAGATGKEVPKKSLPKAGPVDRFNGAVLITLHTAVPARSVLALVHALNNPATPEPASASPTPAN